MATTVGVRDLKNSLSRYLRLVRRGERVVILDRGRPVAILSAITQDTAPRTVEEHLASLAARGLVKLATRRRHRLPTPLRIPGLNLSDAISEDREDRV